MIISKQMLDPKAEELNLCQKNIEDISPLRELIQLKYLALEENQIVDLGIACKSGNAVFVS